MCEYDLKFKATKSLLRTKLVQNWFNPLIKSMTANQSFFFIVYIDFIVFPQKSCIKLTETLSNRESGLVIFTNGYLTQNPAEFHVSKVLFYRIWNNCGRLMMKHRDNKSAIILLSKNCMTKTVAGTYMFWQFPPPTQFLSKLKHREKRGGEKILK